VTIKTAEDLAGDLPDGQLFQITPANIRDVLDSLNAVGVTLYGDELPQAVTTSWALFTAWEAAADSRGLTPNVAAGTITVDPGAGGVYAVDAVVSVLTAANATIELAVFRNGSLSPYRGVVYANSGQARQITLSGSGNLAAGDVVGLAIKASGTGTLTVHNAALRLIRV
jgi:hypothetical protein